MSGSITCPTCGVHRIKPATLRSPSEWLVVETTTWSDECSCSDRELCFYHRFHFDERPVRPSDDVMQARAKVRRDAEVSEWESKRLAFEEAARAKESVADMRQVLQLIIEADALKSHAYERGDDDASIRELIAHALEKSK